MILFSSSNQLISYLDLLENYLMSELQQDTDRDFIFQQDWGTPALPSCGYFRTSIARLLLGLDVVER
jgi:hypothetical protein